MRDLQELTRKMAEIAKEGGAFLKKERQFFQTDKVQAKHPHDYVSYVDKECEEMLAQKLHEILPEAGFITEENTQNRNFDAEYSFVIDPLDGTTNYIRNNAPYCVCIGFRSHSDILAGVVYEVCRDELYMAWKGGPALLNDNPIHTSSISTINEAYAFLELPYNDNLYKETGAWMYDKLYGKTACLRNIGSAAASMCYVAAGRFDVWFESFIGPWDYTAASIIVKQAGGTVTDFRGNPDILTKNHIIATNGPLHPIIVKLLSEAMPNGLVP